MEQFALGGYILIATVSFIVVWYSRRNKFEEEIQRDQKKLGNFLSQVQGEVKAGYGDRKDLRKENEDLKAEKTKLQNQNKKLEDQAYSDNIKIQNFETVIYERHKYGDSRDFKKIESEVIKSREDTKETDPDALEEDNPQKNTKTKTESETPD